MPRTFIPFSSGIHEEVDPKLLPEGNLRSVKNLRIRKDGRLGVRFGFTALGTDIDRTSSALRPIDVMHHDGKLFCWGGTSGDEYPTDLLQYVGDLNGSHDWARQELIAVGLQQRMNPVMALSRVASENDTNQSVATVSYVAVAYANGFVGSATSGSSFGESTLRHGQTGRRLGPVIFGREDNQAMVAQGNVLFLVSIDHGLAGANVNRVDTETEDSGQFVTTVSLSANPIALDAAPFELAGVAGSGFVIATSDATDGIQVHVMTAAGALSKTFSGPAINTTGLAVVSDGTTVTLAVADGTLPDEVRLYTYNISSEALVAGPTSLFSGNPDSVAVPALCDAGDDVFVCIQETDAANGQPRIQGEFRARADHTAGGGFSWEGVELASKPVALSFDPASGDPVPIMVGATFGTASGLRTFALLLITNGMVLSVLSPGIALRPAGAPPAIARGDDGDFYFAFYAATQSHLQTLEVYRARIAEGRRQAASIDGKLYVAGGTVRLYDGTRVFDAAFPRAPRILSASSSSDSGSVSASSNYQMVAVFEIVDADGKRHLSAPSEVATITTGASDDTITISVEGHLSDWWNPATGSQKRVSVVVYRTEHNGVQFHRDNFGRSFNASVIGRVISIELRRADADLLDQEILYTQGSSGARSGPLPFVPPENAHSIWPHEGKILSCGSGGVQESRPPFFGEPIQWSPSIGGRLKLGSEELAVASLDGRRIVWTADAIYQVDGAGLDVNGNGDLGVVRRLPSSYGLYGGKLGWRSIVEADPGVFFQATASKLMLLPRGGGSPVWVGEPVEDLLTSYPSITSAVFLPEEQVVCFTCNNSETSPTDGIILNYDLSTQQWTHDPIGAAISAGTHFQGRHVIIAGGAIQQQNAAHPAAAFIDTELILGTLHPFGQGIEGHIDNVFLVVEFRGDCVITGYLSADDGQSEEELQAKTLSGRTVGSTVTLKWEPNQMVGNRFRIRFTCTEDSGTTEGVVWNYCVVNSTSAGVDALVDDVDQG